MHRAPNAGSLQAILRAWRSGRSGRAAHIGFAPADHALGRGLGVRLGRGRAGAIFKVGSSSRIAAAEPGFGADRQQRQRLRHVVDRAERVQRTCRRRYEPRICRGRLALRYSRRAPRGDSASIRSMSRSLPSPCGVVGRQHLESNYRSNAELTAVLNALLEKIRRLHNRRKHIAEPAEGHRCGRLSTANCGEVLQFCIVSRLSHTSRPSRDRDREMARYALLAGCRDREEDRVTSKKSTAGGDPCRARLRSIRFCGRKATPRKSLAWSRWPRTARK